MSANQTSPAMAAAREIHAQMTEDGARVGVSVKTSDKSLAAMSAIIDRHFQAMLKDGARLNWLQSQNHIIICCEDPGFSSGRTDNFQNYATKVPSVREAIDAAMNPTPSTK